MRLSNQLVNAAEKFAGEENLSIALMPKLSQDIDEQIRPPQKAVDLVDRAIRKIFLTVLR